MFHSDSHLLSREKTVGQAVLSYLLSRHLGSVRLLKSGLASISQFTMVWRARYDIIQVDPGTVSNNTFSPHSPVVPNDISMEADAFKFDWSVLNCGLHCWYD